MNRISKLSAFIICIFLFCAISHAEDYYQIECRIYDSKLNLLKDFQGTFCKFLDDGSFLRGMWNDYLERIGPDGSIKWRKKVKIHHQINLSQSGSEIYTLGHEHRKTKYGWFQFDLFYKLNLESGKVLSLFSMEKNLDKFIENYPTAFKFEIFRLEVTKGNWIFGMQPTHFNSIHEIPDNSAAIENSAFKKGNVVISANSNGNIFVLDSKLKKVIWQKSIQSGTGKTSNIHDVQMLPSGKFLFFANEGLCDLGAAAASVNLYDPVKDKLECLFPRPGTEYSFSEKGKTVKYTPEVSTSLGGAQLLDNGDLLTSMRYEKGSIGYLIGQDNKIKWSFNNDINEKTGKPFYFFIEMKRIDAGKFLLLNKI